MWKPEYAANRRAKYKADPIERDRRKKQGRTPSENAEYMREYYAANPDKFKRTPDQDRERNERRRAAYASDESIRKAARKAAKQWQEENPEKRFAQRLKPYGITPEEYRDILKSQGGGCAICGATESRDDSKRSKNGKRRLHIDHCHQSGKVRGILCSCCNLGLGKFRDDPNMLERAAMFLRAHVRQASPHK